MQRDIDDKALFGFISSLFVSCDPLFLKSGKRCGKRSCEAKLDLEVLHSIPTKEEEKGGSGFLGRLSRWKPMAAAALSSPSFFASAPRPKIPRSVPPATASPFLASPLYGSGSASVRYCRGSFSRYLSLSFLWGKRLCCLYRRLHQVKATTLQETDEKVTVEESFPVKTGEAGTSLSAGEASVVAPWNVKLEQTINIFLTVNHFSECVERHAYSTYDKFIKLHEVFSIYSFDAEELKKLPAPEAAINYYMNEDLYLFGKFLET
ncbi:hypothetical protein GW17_00029083 [Ensete ventricosum]|nr:hypothetical protein GW17_00029083 [Ensete ventricosum]